MDKFIYYSLRFIGKSIEVATWFLFYAAISFVVILVITTLTPWLIKYSVGFDPTSAEAGQYGDQFGYANAIISALAFGGLIVTIQLQRKDLQEQRAESNRARLATEQLIELQAKELESNLHHAEISAFEQMYFRLLELKESVVSNIVYTQYDAMARQVGQPIKPTKITKYEGRAAIARYSEEAADNMTSTLRDTDYRSYDARKLLERRVQLAEHYESWYRSNDNDVQLGHYFRLVYNILRAIHDHRGLEDIQRYGYVRLFRAQLTDSELWLLFCNCISHQGWRRMMPLANRYHLFDNLYFSHDYFGMQDRFLTSSRMTGDEVHEDVTVRIYSDAEPVAEGQENWPPGRGFGS